MREQAGDLPGGDPRQSPGPARSDHRAVVDPRQPGLIDGGGAHGTDARQFQGSTPPADTGTRPDGHRPLLPREHGRGQHHAKPRGTRGHRRGMPGDRFVQALDADLLGDPRRAQVHFQLGCRAVMEVPVEMAVESDPGARDEELAAYAAGQLDPRLEEHEFADRSGRLHLEGQAVDPGGLRAVGGDETARLFPALANHMELVEDDRRPAAGPGRIEGPHRRDPPSPFGGGPGRAPGTGPRRSETPRPGRPSPASPARGARSDSPGLNRLARRSARDRGPARLPVASDAGNQAPDAIR